MANLLRQLGQSFLLKGRVGRWMLNGSLIWGASFLWRTTLGHPIDAEGKFSS